VVCISAALHDSVAQTLGRACKPGKSSIVKDMLQDQEPRNSVLDKLWDNKTRDTPLVSSSDPETFCQGRTSYSRDPI
jgi:hypothetical protein